MLCASLITDDSRLATWSSSDPVTLMPVFISCWNSLSSFLVNENWFISYFTKYIAQVLKYGPPGSPTRAPFPVMFLLVFIQAGALQGLANNVKFLLYVLMTACIIGIYQDKEKCITRIKVNFVNFMSTENDQYHKDFATLNFLSSWVNENLVKLKSPLLSS